MNSENLPLEDQVSAFVRHFESDDLLQLVVRGHVYVEFALNTVIDMHLENPQFFKVERQNFAMKIKLAAALGAIQPQLQVPLGKLNALRARLAHRLDQEVSHDDLQELMDSLLESTRFDRTMIVPLLASYESRSEESEKSSIRDFDTPTVFGFLIALLMDILAPHKDKETRRQEQQTEVAFGGGYMLRYVFTPLKKSLRVKGKAMKSNP